MLFTQLSKVDAFETKSGMLSKTTHIAVVSCSVLRKAGQMLQVSVIIKQSKANEQHVSYRGCQGNYFLLYAL